MTNGKRYLRDLSPEAQKELTEDMLRVGREMQDMLVSTFEKTIRLLIGFNAGGILLISGLVAGLARGGRTSGLLAAAGAFFVVGLICSGTPAFLLMRRLRRLAAETLVDNELVHANKLSVDDASDQLQSRTRHPKFAQYIDGLVAGAIIFFLVGAVVALVAVTLLSPVSVGATGPSTYESSENSPAERQGRASAMRRSGLTPAGRS